MDLLGNITLVDQTEDAFMDATGIDASASTAEVRNAANYYSGVSGTRTNWRNNNNIFFWW